MLYCKQVIKKDETRESVGKFVCKKHSVVQLTVLHVTIVSHLVGLNNATVCFTSMIYHKRWGSQHFILTLVNHIKGLKARSTMPTWVFFRLLVDRNHLLRMEMVFIH